MSYKFLQSAPKHSLQLDVSLNILIEEICRKLMQSPLIVQLDVLVSSMISYPKSHLKSPQSTLGFRNHYTIIITTIHRLQEDATTVLHIIAILNNLLFELAHEESGDLVKKFNELVNPMIQQLRQYAKRTLLPRKEEVKKIVAKEIVDADNALMSMQDKVVVMPAEFQQLDLRNLSALHAQYIWCREMLCWDLNRWYERYDASVPFSTQDPRQEKRLFASYQQQTFDLVFRERQNFDSAFFNVSQEVFREYLQNLTQQLEQILDEHGFSKPTQKKDMALLVRREIEHLYPGE